MWKDMSGEVLKIYLENDGEREREGGGRVLASQLEA